MDLTAVRTFVAVVDTGQFQEAAIELDVTQQAVSKRVAGLEKDLGVRLLARTARGAQLTIDGQAFLPHARDLLRAEERAAASVRPGRRALRVDVIARRLATAGLLRDFHRGHPEVDLDVIGLPLDAGAAMAALGSGTIDASFRAVTVPRSQLPDGLTATRVLDEPLQLVTGVGHPLAKARAVTPTELAGHRIWMPGIVTGTEWAAFYDELATAFGLTIDPTGPNFGPEALLDTIADSSTWPPSSGRAPASSGRPTPACAASRSTTRPPSTPTRWSGTATTPTPRSAPSATTSPLRHHARPAVTARPGPRHGHSHRRPRDA